MLRLSIGKALAPDMETATGAGTKVHPRLIRRPSHVGARGSRRSNRFAGGAGIEGDKPAGQPATVVHLYDEQPLAVGRKRRAVGHAAFARRKVDLADLFARGCGSDNPHVNT